MIDELRLNTKLFGFDGVIGRRDYFLNLIYIFMIETVLIAPYTISMLSGAESILDLFNLTGFFVQSSIFLKIWAILVFGFIAYLDMGLSIRRLNDINGKVNKPLNIAMAVFTVLTAYSLIMPAGIMATINFFAFVVTSILLFKTGKITSKFPYDFRKEFNWGAFFGTWIWGIVNKSYHTFWYWILWWTPIGFYYKLICGLKGNEWAYKNRNWESVQQFNRAQEKQTLIFTILYVLIFPILMFVFVFAIVCIMGFAIASEQNTSPEHKSETLSALNKFANAYSSLYFESHTITETENKFYILPEDWNSYSFNEKADIFKKAATTAATERSSNGQYSNKSQEYPRTKIYSSTNGELLGEFVLDDSIYESQDAGFKEVLMATMKAFKFYKATIE